MDFLQDVARKSAELDLKVGNVAETQDIFPFIHQVQASVLAPDGSTIFGKGISRIESHAYKKAIGEAIERLCFRFDGRFETTNGIALHTDLSIAEIKAKCELLERDSYLCHFYTKTPFYRYLRSDIEGSLFDEVESALEKHGFTLFIARLSSREDLFISIAICVDSSKGFCSGLKIGLGCDSKVTESLDSAILESIALVPLVVSGGELPVLTREDFFSRPDKFSVNDFIALSSSQWAVEVLQPFISNVRDFVPTKFEPKVNFVELDKPKMLKDMAFYVLKANSPDCQELFFRSKIEGNLNFNRLMSFVGHSLNRHTIPNIPHFLA